MNKTILKSNLSRTTNSKKQLRIKEKRNTKVTMTSKINRKIVPKKLRMMKVKILFKITKRHNRKINKIQRKIILRTKQKMETNKNQKTNIKNQSNWEKAYVLETTKRNKRKTKINKNKKSFTKCFGSKPTRKALLTRKRITHAIGFPNFPE